MVYKNKGLVKKGCCVVQSGPPVAQCIVPTISNITVVRNGSFFVCTVTITGSPMQLQWYYITGSGPTKNTIPFIDNPPNVSGSTTTQLTLDSTLYAGYRIVCFAPDPCAGGGIAPAISSNEVTLP